MTARKIIRGREFFDFSHELSSYFIKEVHAKQLDLPRDRDDRTIVGGTAGACRGKGRRDVVFREKFQRRDAVKSLCFDAGAKRRGVEATIV